MKFVNRAFREGSLGCKLPSTTQPLLPWSSCEDNLQASISTLTDRELLIATCEKEEGWNHEHTRRPFLGWRFFIWILVFVCRFGGSFLKNGGTNEKFGGSFPKNWKNLRKFRRNFK